MTRTAATQVGTAVIDPLAPAAAGTYRDQLVEVSCENLVARPFESATLLVETRHFCLYRHRRRIQVSHWLRPLQIDNDISGMIATELFEPGWLSGTDIFESVFTGVVRSAVADPARAWETFYGNTIARVRQEWSTHPGGAGHSTIAGIAPVYARALRCIPPGAVLDLGSCFGFFALLLAGRGRNTVTASDLSAGTMRLLDTVVDSWRIPLSTMVADAGRVPLPDKSVDTVTVLHLLEHLDPIQGNGVVREAMRLARRRVVIAVPYEDEPSAVYGHVRRFDTSTLTGIGVRTGCRFGVSEHHGGWLVVNTA